MLKLTILFIGIVIGFSGGMMWSVHNPQQAAKITNDEETKFLQAQLAVTQATQNRLDKLIESRKNANSNADTTELASLRDQAHDQADKLQKEIDQVAGH